MTAARRPGAVADVLVTTQEDVQVLLGAPPGACRTIRDEDVDARVALWKDIPEYGAARLVSAGPLLVKVLRSVNIDADVSMFPAAHAQKVFCYVLDALFVKDDGSITITSDELRRFFDGTVSVRSPISTAFPVVIRTSTLVQVSTLDLEALGLQQVGRVLFVHRGAMDLLFHTRTEPMLSTLTKRATHISFEALQQRLHVFIGASGAGKTIRMLQVASDEACVDAAVFCQLSNLFSLEEMQSLSKYESEEQKKDRDLQVSKRLFELLNANPSVCRGRSKVALLVDECGPCPDFVRAVAAQYSAIQVRFQEKGVDLGIIAAGTGAVSNEAWASNPKTIAVESLDAPPNLQQELEDECPWLKLLNKGKASKWYKAMMRNSRAATCLARTLNTDMGQWVAAPQSPMPVDCLAPTVLTMAAHSFTSLNALAGCDIDDLRQLHLRAAHISNEICDNLGGVDVRLIRTHGILTDAWAGKSQKDTTRPRYKLDVGSHAVLLLTGGGLAGALADTGDEFEAEALVWLRFGLAVGDAALQSKEHTHFNSMFRCSVPLVRFVPPLTAPVENAQAFLRDNVPAASLVGKHCKPNPYQRTQPRAVRTFLLKQRIDPGFLETLPAKLRQVGAPKVAGDFENGQITSLSDLAIALSKPEDYKPATESNGCLPFALMQAVLDTSDDVWIFQNAAGAEFADIIVVWKNAVWLIRAKHYEEPTHHEWQIFNDEHKMGSGAMEADCAACVSVATVGQLTLSGLGEYCTKAESSTRMRVDRDFFFEEMTKMSQGKRHTTQAGAAPEVAAALDESVKIVQFLFGAREVRRAHVVYTNEDTPDFSVPAGVILRKLTSASAMLHGPSEVSPRKSQSDPPTPATVLPSAWCTEAPTKPVVSSCCTTLRIVESCRSSDKTAPA